MRKSSQWLGIVWVVALSAACGETPSSSAPEDPGSPPGVGGSSGANDFPADPGANVPLALDGAAAEEYAALQRALAEPMTAELFAERYGLNHGELGYDPTKAAHLDLIQNSSLALTSEELALLEQNGFVISTRREFPTFGYGYVSIYGDDLPLYISADSILHAVHRSYGDILKAIETEALIPTLAALLDGMRSRLASTAAALPERTRADADFYLAVARSLVGGNAAAPVAGADAAAIASFVESALEANGMSSLEIFGVRRDIDFSQFTPRGHYTDSEELSRYFRAMIWLGRIDFRLIETQPNHSQVFHRRQFEAMVALRQLMGAEELDRFWKIDQTIEGFVGESDYMTVPQVDALLADLGASNLAEAATIDDETIAQAIVSGRYGTQRIASHIMMNGVGEGTLPLSSSFLVFGQRYVVDSHVFSNVVYDRVQGGQVKRMMPSPLDAAFAALGNDQAGALLANEIEQYGYAQDLHAMRVLVDGHGGNYWESNLYNLWLGALRALSPVPSAVADPEGVGLPQIAGTEPWGRRLLNTQLASWAELRHDTILYVKQSYTAGVACEFPDAYVDPYPEVYRKLARFAEQGAQRAAAALEGVSGNLAQAVTDYFAHLHEVTVLLSEMADHQRQGIAFTAEQMAFVNDTVVEHVEGCGWPTWMSGWYGRLFFNPYATGEWDPVVADVHTQPTDELGSLVGRVLHVGTGNARLMVVTADTCNGPRAYVGLASSYFEKVTSGFERLTDDEWATSLHRDPPAEVEWLQPVLAEP